MLAAKFIPAGLSLVVHASSLAACAVEPNVDDATSSSSSIVGGSVTSDYPAVGALTRSGRSFCTGTVVAPRIVVTVRFDRAGRERRCEHDERETCGDELCGEHVFLLSVWRRAQRPSRSRASN